MTSDESILDFTSPAQARLLFLDFDGVLHPAGCDPERYLCCLPLLESTLRAAPPVEIVISSTWQEAYSIKALKARFSPDIGARILGGTLVADPEGEEETRYGQIRRFLRWKGWGERSWFALDDAAHEFPDECAQLIPCVAEQGLDEATANVLLERLRG